MLEKSKLLFRMSLLLFLSSPLFIYLGHRIDWGYDRRLFFGREGEELLHEFLTLQTKWDTAALILLFFGTILSVISIVLYFVHLFRTNHSKTSHSRPA
jgi:hypothetical protein